MLKQLTIKNFKSIADDTMELGRVNVFIGENGCGKSNILEAVMFAGLAETYETIDADLLSLNGVRVAKPTLMMSAFKQKKRAKDIFMIIDFEQYRFTYTIKPNNIDNIYTKWYTINSCIAKDYTLMGISNSVESIENINSEIAKWQEIADIHEVMLAISKKLDEDDSNLIDERNIIERKKIYLEGAKNLKENYFKLKDSSDSLHLQNYLIYTLNTPALRGIPEFIHSRKGIYGETLDVMLAQLDKSELELLKTYIYSINWLDDFFIDEKDKLKSKGYKLNQSKSLLYFSDKFMQDKYNIFSSENANEGILHILFYLALTISKKTPKFFAIDNIESCLNPHLCRHLMTEMCKLAKENDKQMLITTHNPAILDGLNLYDEEIRLFEVKRNDKGHTVTRRIKLKPDVKNEVTGETFKLSELWTRGFLGAISKDF